MSRARNGPFFDLAQKLRAAGLLGASDDELGQMLDEGIAELVRSGPEAGARPEGDHRPGQCGAPRSEAQGGAQEKDPLEVFEPLNDPFDFVNHRIERIEADRMAQFALLKGPCRELYQHGNLGINVRLRREGRGKANTGHFALLIGFPIGLGARVPNFYYHSVKHMDFDFGRLGNWDRDNVVLVGVREFVNKDERMAVRLFISMERLHPVQQIQPVGYTVDTASRVGVGLPLVTGGTFVTRIRNKYGELVSLRAPGTTFLDECGNYVIQRAAEAVYEIANDDAEFVFSEFARRKIHDTPAVFVDLTKAEGERCTLVYRPGGRMDFSQECFKVYARPCNLCLGLGKVQTKRSTRQQRRAIERGKA